MIFILIKAKRNVGTSSCSMNFITWANLVYTLSFVENKLTRQLWPSKWRKMIQSYAKVRKNISKFMNYKAVSQTCFIWTQIWKIWIRKMPQICSLLTYIPIWSKWHSTWLEIFLCRNVMRFTWNNKKRNYYYVVCMKCVKVFLLIVREEIVKPLCVW